AAAVRAFEPLASLGLFQESAVLSDVDARRFDSIIGAFAAAKPDAVINCIGIVKQRAEANDPIPSLEINARFPHRLAQLCRATGSRLIHISTDCVFSGKKGMYTEQDQSDAEDLYGRSKFLGEVGEPPALTLRTSIIGREIESRYGLVEWFLGSRGRVRGFTGAIYSGFTTLEFSKIIARVLLDFPDLSGVYHVSSDPISKHDL